VKDPRATVAIILALTIFVFVASGTVGREILTSFGLPLIPIDPEIAARWESIVSVIVGVLAGYVMGRDDNGKP
jgi:hypothetical protein